MDLERKIINPNKQDYKMGDLSLFPKEMDDDISLFSTENNSISILTGRVNVKTEIINVSNTNKFPTEGIIRINNELIYYKSKSEKSFFNLLRGFNGTSLMNHSTGSLVLGCVAASHHNSVRDAIINSENKTGLLLDNPDINGSLTSRVKFLDIKWFTPTARFFAQQRKGHFPLKVCFRNWSLGDPYIDYVWDFGDEGVNSVSTEKHPIHVYDKPGYYTVTLKVRSSDGRRSFLSKSNYVEVYDENVIKYVFGFVRDFENKNKLVLSDSGIPLYDNRIPFSVEFVDQTPGNIKQKIWNFGDGTVLNIYDEYHQIIKHVYTKDGIYWPELQVIDVNDISKVYKFKQPVIVGIGNKISKEEMILGLSKTNQESLLKPTSNSNVYLKLKFDSVKNMVVLD